MSHKVRWEDGLTGGLGGVKGRDSLIHGGAEEGRDGAWIADDRVRAGRERGQSLGDTWARTAA